MPVKVKGVLVCFAGPLDGQRVAVSRNIRKIADGQGGFYYRKKFESIGREALIYGVVDMSAIDLEIICRGCDGDRNDHDGNDHDHERD
jgi:hypothetical protein